MMPPPGPADWLRIREVFEEALARPVGEREAYVASACGREDALRCQVQALLDAHNRAATFLETPAAVDMNSAHLIASVSGTDRPPAVAPQLSTLHVGRDFRGTERFRVVRQLGTGGMGVVYEVHDRVRDQVVALKTLRHAGAADVLRLKREFRSLADIAHANLVCLYELLVDSEHCFFTMEHVDGQRISDYIQEPLSDPSTSPTLAERARHTLRQLVSGILALHQHGKLHRDIKPSNVLVTPEGRVVILDFGLVSDVGPSDFGTSDRRGGTLAYFAPELLGGAAPSEASDWYSVGVTLHEALTGRLPSTGALEKLLEGDSEGEVKAPDVPDDLWAICRGLLRADPTTRLSGRDVLGRLGLDSAIGGGPMHVETRRHEPLFVGRGEPLAVLREAFGQVRSGRGATVYIHGRSGIGKSALLRRFIAEVTTIEQVVVLRGRCFEHESVPFAALDGVVDSLSAYLSARPLTEARSFMPPGVGALARVFPVMLQVESVATAVGEESGSLDPSSQRRQAVTALRDLLARMAEHRTMVLCIDDLHWADADSTRLLDELLGASAPLPILTLGCFRTEEIAAKPFLQSLVDRTGVAHQTTVALDPLTQDEARALVASLIPADCGVAEAERRDIARDGGGSPFLLEQLAHYVASAADSTHRTATLADMLEQRVTGLPIEARRFLEVVVVCGRPMASAWIHEAAGLAGDDRPLLARLRADHLVRNSGSAARIEVFHDRIRETLAARLAPDRARVIHDSLFRTLVARGSDDSEALFEHARGAGERGAAAHHAASAAAKAGAALAFDKAALLYRHAVELAPASPDAGEWNERLADALTNAGRPHDAAEVYLHASQRADRARLVELQRRAAEQFLIGGHIDRGLSVIANVLRALNMRLASGPLTALAPLVWRRAGIRWRGLSFEERRADAIPAATLLPIDTCWSVATGLAMVDYTRAALFSTRHLTLALDAGEPYRVVRAMALESVFLSSAGLSRKWAAACTERAAALAERTGHPHALALSTLSAGATAVMAGEWTTALRLCRRALDTLRTSCAGATWEISLAESFVMGVLLFQGEVREASARLPPLLTEARDRGNLYFETELRTRMNLVWLAADEADEGERHANEAMERWSHERYHRQHYSHVLARVQTELYRGRAEEAWELIDSNWAPVERAMLRRIRFFRVETAFLRARSALLMAASGHDRRRFTSIARGDARRIRRVGMRWSNPLAMLADAGADCLSGATTVAAERLAAAAEAFDAADMKLYAAVARRRLGVMTGGTDGQRLLRNAEDWMAAEGIKRPDRISRLLAPGFPDPPSSLA